MRGCRSRSCRARFENTSPNICPAPTASRIPNRATTAYRRARNSRVIDASRSDAPPRRVTLSPGETVADAARKAIAFGAESLLRNQNAAEAGEVEPLHQLRVATRRLRASIELFANVIYAAQLKIFRRDIPWIAHQAGACRECDVTSALISARAEKIGTDLSVAIA